MIKKEWQSIWKDKKLTLSIAVMFFMPLLYAGVLLYAFWDPYHHLNNLPVALINEDKGAELNGEALHLGDELTKELLENKDMNFIEIDASHGQEGLLNGDYYLLIRVPENFSENATTLMNDNPEKLELEYEVNKGSNFISAQIGGNAVEKIRAKVNDEVAKTYASELFTVISKLGDGYVDAADAASQIEDGAQKLADGSSDLKGYLYQLASSTVTLSDGTSSLKEGIVKAAKGSADLKSGLTSLNDGAIQMQDGMNAAADGAQKVSEGVSAYTEGVTKAAAGHEQVLEGQQQFQQGVSSLTTNSAALTDGASSLATGATQVSQGITQVQQQIEALLPSLPEEQANQLKAALSSIAEGSQSVEAGAKNLSDKLNQFNEGAASLQQNGTALLQGQQQVAQGLNQLEQNSASLNEGANALLQGNLTLANKMADLTAGTTQLVSGADQLNNGLNEITSGSTKLADGTKELASKSNELAEGSVELVEGTDKLKDGSGKLASSLEDAGKEASLNATDDQIDMTVNPVELNETVYNDVDKYGVGFAPYFISLGLFIGALLLTNVYPFVQPVGQPTGIISWFTSKSSILIVVSIFQIIFTYVLMKFGLRLQVEHELWLILTICVTSFAFMAIVQVFTVLLGDVGRFITLILLVIQLGGSAGTFPLELLPEPLQAIHNWLPMSYSVSAFRAAISTNDGTVLLHKLSVLGTIGIVCVLITFAFFALLYKRRYSKEQAA